MDVAPGYSLVIPVYNVERYLDRCLQSVLSQSYRDFEVILVDDGSSDRSGAICDDYAGRFCNVRVIHKENGGLSSARNAGLQAAAGEYIWFIDSDDWIESSALEQINAAARDQAPEIIRFGYCRWEKDREKEEKLPLAVQDGDMEALRRAAFCSAGKYILSACTHLYRRDFLKRIQLEFVSERLCGSEDYLFNLTALMQAEHVAMLQAPLYHYEMRAGSLTQQYKPDLPQKYTRLYSMLLEAAQKSAPRYTKMIQAFYVWHLIYGTCFTYEYKTLTQQHGISEGRANVRSMLRTPELQRALRQSSCMGLPAKRWVHWAAMRLRAEPFFYWLFVVRAK